MADFNKIQKILDNLYETDEKAKENINSTGLTLNQLKVVNSLIISALKAYDSEVRNG